ncbi:MAG: PIN domain-containing protein [Thermoplasmata archaeon]|nr:MAG: PIN domain-containing protein [Thermoplasmata archaeon]
MVNVYLDTDCILALVKESDWLKTPVEKRIKNEKGLCTSVMSVVESRLVLMREENIESVFRIEEKLNSLKIKLLPLDENIISESNNLMKDFDFLATFDAIHIATAKLHKEKVLSTDHIFKLVPGLTVEDPRGD